MTIKSPWNTNCFLSLIKQRNRLFAPFVCIIEALLCGVGRMFEVQLFDNEFIMISADKQFQCAFISRLALARVWTWFKKNKKIRLCNYLCWTCIISVTEVRKGDWHFREMKFHGKQIAKSCLESFEISWRILRSPDNLLNEDVCWKTLLMQQLSVETIATVTGRTRLLSKTDSYRKYFFLVCFSYFFLDSTRLHFRLFMILFI